ncbi:hypothetical protein WR25_05008 [Diploscapter pachys]|uniref:RRM domain-containing protein n=1 Tax=Diploscapter pachys TaxID=2018661 RepID=A0A2A2J528_9BILA|nr:hypothetical protein WR25_05008 [Diploscapter pachys]
MVTTITAPEVGSWAEVVEQESQSSNDINEDGVKTVVSYITENGQKFKIATTLIADEVDLQFTRNHIGEQILDVQEEKVVIKSENQMHCRHCKGDDHWSTTCPYKDFMQTEEETPDTERAGREAGTVPGGRYVPPMRSGMDRQTDRRSDENTCRVTNLPQDMDESELREIFTKIGRCTRVFIARDKITNLPKGFAFVTYENREDAARAIRELNNYKVNHMVLKVEWTRPSNDK